MHEIAEAGAGAFAHLVLSTASFAEVGDWRQLGVDRSATKPAIVEVAGCLFGVRLMTKLYVNIAHQMVAQVVAHVHLLDLAVLVLALHEHILEEIVVVLLHLLVGDIGHQMRAIGRFGRVLRIHIQILEQHSL